MTAAQQHSFSRPWWLCNTHLETVWARGIGEAPDYSREIARTPDNDPVAFDSLAGQPGQPAVAIFHGLEGCSTSHTVRQCAQRLNAFGWHVTVPHFRTCGVMNELPRAYHAGDSADIDWMLRFVAARHPAGTPLFALGISLGGNALAKWAAENPGKDIVTAAATVCAPLDLTASSRRLESLFNRLTYGRHFLARLKRKMRAKIRRYPFLISERELEGISSIRGFDERLTAPMHGFDGADDYYRKASALPLLGDVAIPMLCVHSDNDALIPLPAMPPNPHVVQEQTRGGGHSGFVTGPMPGRTFWLAERAAGFFQAAT